MLNRIRWNIFAECHLSTLENVPVGLWIFNFQSDGAWLQPYFFAEFDNFMAWFYVYNIIHQTGDLPSFYDNSKNLITKNS